MQTRYVLTKGANAPPNISKNTLNLKKLYVPLTWRRKPFVLLMIIMAMMIISSWRVQIRCDAIKSYCYNTQCGRVSRAGTIQLLSAAISILETIEQRKYPREFHNTPAKRRCIEARAKLKATKTAKKMVIL